MAPDLDHAVFWIVTAASLGFTCTFIVIAYRIFFHPLADYPGPLIARVTNVYQLYHAWKGDRHLEFWRLHQQYGPVVRFGPNSLSFNTAEGLRGIYGFRTNARKSDFYDAFVHPMPNTHNVRDRAIHARKRRVLSQAFSDGAMKESEPYLISNMESLCRVVNCEDEAKDEGWSVTRNMGDYFSYLAMDVLGDLCFGKAFHMLDRNDNRYTVDLVSVAAKRHLMCGTMPIIDRLGIDKFLFPGIAAGRSRYMAYSKAQLTERTKQGEKSDRKDFFYHLLKARDPETGQGFSTPELWSESNLLIIAGSDTTSTAMAATLFYLLRNSSALASVILEVRNKFSSTSEIRNGSTLASCSYLRACIDEAMRLSPSVPGLLPREVLAGGAVINGLTIPEGTIVGTPHYALHHNPDNYPQPFEYVPERWLVGRMNPLTQRETSPDELAAAQAAFCPFSVGPRGCIGKGLAYHEMTATLARLLFEFDVRSPDGVLDPGEGKRGAEWGRHRKGEFQLIDSFISQKDGPLVQFKRVAS